MSKLKANENKYNFVHINPTEFETNNSNIPLAIFDESNKKIYTTKDDSTNKEHIVQLKNNRYAALKPFENKFTWLEKMLKSFSHKELKDYIINHVNSNDLNNTNNDTKDSNDLNDSSK